MVFGVTYDADEFVEEITQKERGRDRTMKGRRNSLDDLPRKKTDKSKSRKQGVGLINTISDNTNTTS